MHADVEPKREPQQQEGERRTAPLGLSADLTFSSIIYFRATAGRLR